MFSSSPPNTSSPLPSSPAVNGGVGAGSYFNSQAVASSSSSTPSLAPASSPLPTAPDTIPQLLQRRIATLTFLNHSLSGHSNWLHSVRLGKRELDAAFPPETMRKRTTRFLLLGLALAPLLEVPTLPDACKTILSILSELDALQDAADKDKKRNFNPFGTRSRILRRPTIGVSDLTPHDPLGGVTAGGGASSGGSVDGNLLLPNVPFQLDYFQVFTTLCDMLVEVYSKLLSFVSPPVVGFPSAPPAMASTGYGSVRSTATYDGAGTASSISGSLGPNSGHSLGAEMDDGSGAYPQSTLSVPSQYPQHHTAQQPAPPAALSNAHQDLLLKADAKLKKVIAQIVKELDSLARHLVKEELASVESILRRPSAAPAPNGSPGVAANAWPGMPASATSPSTPLSAPHMQGRSVSDFGSFQQSAGGE